MEHTNDQHAYPQNDAGMQAIVFVLIAMIFGAGIGIALSAWDHRSSSYEVTNVAH